MDETLLDYSDVLSSYMMNVPESSISRSSHVFGEKRKICTESQGREMGNENKKTKVFRFSGDGAHHLSIRKEFSSQLTCDLQANQNFDFKIQHPSSLFEICTDYVAVNVHLVESFVAFPDDVGKKIFSTCESKKVFDVLDSRSIGAMTLFAEAYCDTVLSSMNLTGCHRVLGMHLEQFVIFQHLAKVDLTSCKLGDDHDILSYLSALTW
jgi:hypothetical protein